MSCLEEIRNKEKIFAFYALFSSQLKSQVKIFLKDFINSAINDSRKKLTPTFPEDKTNAALEVMKESYLAAAAKHEQLIDEVIESSFVLPSPMETEDLCALATSGDLDKEINELQTRILALKDYGKELLKMEDDLSEVRRINFDTYEERLQKINASYEQQRQNFELLCDLLSSPKPDIPTQELEDSVMNMSIG